MRLVVTWVLVGWFALTSLVTIGTVGKSRPPLTPSMAVSVTILAAIMATAILYIGEVL